MEKKINKNMLLVAKKSLATIFYSYNPLQFHYNQLLTLTSQINSYQAIGYNTLSQ